MAKIILQSLDFSTVETPSVGEYILGVDVDGLPKLKTATDLLVLYATQSVYLNFYEVSYSQFVSKIDTSTLEKGSVYLINDFRTNHYIQYTDTPSYDGTGLNESTRLGSLEKLLVRATDVNNYDSHVKSLDYPDDIIIWRHDVADREYDYYQSSGKGCIIYRESKNKNSRNYDFRNVKFRRWDDGFGNYTVVRGVDATNISSYLDFYSFDDSISYNNKVGFSPNLNSTYALDNVVVATSSNFQNNVIREAFGSTINAKDFSNNNIDFLSQTNFNSGTFSSNNISKIVNSSINSDLFLGNKLDISISSTFSKNTLYNNFSMVENSSLGTASNNNINHIFNSNIRILEKNSILELSNSSVIVLQNNSINNLVGCSASSVINNTVNSVVNLVSENFTNNFGSLIQNNSVSNISNNKINNLISNTASSIIGNSGLTVSSNRVTSILNNNVDIIESNVGTFSISGNTGKSIIVNSSGVVNNTVDVISSNLSYISDNIGKLISNNSPISSTISNNRITTIVNNQLGMLEYNSGESFTSNSSTSSYIGYNSFNLFNSNVLNRISFSYNTGNIINSNSIISSTQSTEMSYNNLQNFNNNNFSNFRNVTHNTLSNGFSYNSIIGSASSFFTFSNNTLSNFNYTTFSNFRRIQHNEIYRSNMNTISSTVFREFCDNYVKSMLNSNVSATFSRNSVNFVIQSSTFSNEFVDNLTSGSIINITY